MGRALSHRTDQWLWISWIVSTGPTTPLPNTPVAATRAQRAGMTTTANTVNHTFGSSNPDRADPLAAASMRASTA